MQMLFVAFREDDLELCMKLISEGADINEQEFIDGRPLRTALNEASKRGNDDIVKILIQAGADLELRDYLGETALMKAAWREHDSTVSLLIEAGADINAEDITGSTAIMWAADQDHVEITRLLIHSGANLHISNDLGETVLMKAASRGHLEIVSLLIEAGVDLNMADDDGTTAITSAVLNDQMETVKLLFEAGADVHYDAYEYPQDEDDDEEEGHCCYWPDATTDIVEYLSNAGVDLDMRDKNGSTALIKASRDGCEEAVRALIAAGADLNKFNIEMTTPLIVAIRSEQESIARMLLNTRLPDVHAKDEEGWTALTAALSGHMFDVAQILIDRGADEEIEDPSGLWMMKEVVQYLRLYKLK